MKVENILVTPAMAKKMLEMNTRNFRIPDVRRIDLYASEMVRGRWENNGETIKFSDGVLVDGQHRLLAVIQSGMSVLMLVVTGAEGVGFGIDRGKPRTMTQWLTHMEVKNASSVASVARLCVAYQKGKWTKSLQVNDVTDSEIIDFANANMIRMQQAVLVSRQACGIVPPSALGAVVFLGTVGEIIEGVNDTAIWFCNRLRDGEMLRDHDAVLHVRNTFQKLKRGASFSQQITRAYLTLAWNRTALGQPSNFCNLRITMTGPTATVLPEKIELMQN